MLFGMVGSPLKLKTFHGLWLGNITIYKYWVQPVVVEVVRKIQQLVEVYFLLLTDLPKLFGWGVSLINKLLRSIYCGREISYTSYPWNVLILSAIIIINRDLSLMSLCFIGTSWVNFTRQCIVQFLFFFLFFILRVSIKYYL